MRNKKGQFIKGLIPHNKGIKGLRDSEETKNKKSESAKKSAKRRIETRHKNGWWKNSEETRKRKGGKVPWNKDKTGVYPESTLKIMSERKRGLFKGNKHPNWQNGITPLYLQIRHCLKARQFGDDCYTRDDHTCQKCGERGGRLCVHHIKNFSDIIKENDINSLKEAEQCVELWNINNGVVLCREDHKKFHKMFGFRSNNREQLLEFLKEK